MKFIYIVFRLNHAHVHICRHPPYIYITYRGNSWWYTCYCFQELPDQEVTRTPKSFLPTQELPPWGTLHLALQSAMVMSFWGHIMYKTSFCAYRWKFFSRLLGSMMILEEREVVGSCIPKFGPRFRSPIDCGHFNYCHHVLVSSSVNALSTVGHGVSIARRVSLFFFCFLNVNLLHGLFLFFTAEIVLNDGLNYKLKC